MSEPYGCLERLPAKSYADLLQRAVFECCFWRTQVEGRPLLCPFPLVLKTTQWRSLAEAAEALAQETHALEAALVHRPELFVDLGLPPGVAKAIGRFFRPGRSIRVIRFDFHWTTEGWRISEANSDVMGGFIEASGVSQLMARYYANAAAIDDPAAALAKALAPHARVGLMHIPMFYDDRQMMIYLAKRLNELGTETCLLAPDQISWRRGRALVNAPGHRGFLGSLLRFYPAHWLYRLGPPSHWRGFWNSAKRCSAILPRLC